MLLVRRLKLRKYRGDKMIFVGNGMMFLSSFEIMRTGFIE